MATKSYLDKARANISSNTDKDFENVFLVLGGSFNPLHKEHIVIFEQAREYLLTHRKKVIAGFLVLAEDIHILYKLAWAGGQPEELIPFAKRHQLALLACQHSDFVSPYPTPECNAEGLTPPIEAALPGARGLVLCGADLLSRGAYGRAGVVVAHRDEISLDTVLVRRRKSGAETFVLPPTAATATSSTKCRAMMHAREWEQLRQSDMLHPTVLDQLQSWTEGAGSDGESDSQEPTD